MQHLFDLQLEIIALFSSYAEFEPRTMTASMKRLDVGRLYELTLCAVY